MKYNVEVKLSNGHWAKVKPAGGMPYEFTQEEAEAYVSTHTQQSGRPDNYRLVAVIRTEE